MKFQHIVFALSLATTSALGAQPASSCLSKADPKNCLANFAISSLAKDKNAGSRIAGAAALITTLAKANMRRDDILTMVKDDEMASILARWTLAVSRNTYIFRFELPLETQESNTRLNIIGQHLRSSTIGMDRFTVILAACEAMNKESKQAQEKWNGALDDFCSMNQSDADAIEREFPNLSVVTKPLVAAYQKDSVELGNSLGASIKIISDYQNLLTDKLPSKDREFIHTMIFLGHIFNAWALATANHGVPAVKALELAMKYSDEKPSIDQAKEFQVIKSMMSWIYAKAGMREEALKMIKTSLHNIDRNKNSAGGEIAAVLALAIETLHELEALR